MSDFKEIEGRVARDTAPETRDTQQQLRRLHDGAAAVVDQYYHGYPESDAFAAAINALHALIADAAILLQNCPRPLISWDIRTNESTKRRCRVKEC